MPGNSDIQKGIGKVTRVRMSIAAISEFLATPANIQQALEHDADFQGFYDLAVKSSGESAVQADIRGALFRVAEPGVGVRENLTVRDRIRVFGQPTAISELVEVYGHFLQIQLIHSLWRLETFDEIKLWLRSLKVVLRLASDLDGQLRGNLLLAESIIPMVEAVERKDYVLLNGDMASDAITRAYGIRAKVFTLDRARRLTRGATHSSVMDRLSRTQNKL